MSNPRHTSAPKTKRAPLTPSDPPRDPRPSGSGSPSGGRDVGKALAYFAVGGYYDHQKQRTAHMNRIRDIIRKVNEGIPLDKVEPKQEEKKYAKKYRDESLPDLLKQMEAEKKVTPEQVAHINKLLSIAEAEHGLEDQYRDVIKPWVVVNPVYQDFLRKIKGLKGYVLSGGLLAWFDPARADHPSSYWKYAGMHVVDGKAPKPKRGEKLDFNPKIRTHLWKVSDAFVKHRTDPYRKIYDETKATEAARLEKTGEKGWKGHADARARRKMIKAFLVDFWVAGRTAAGLPVTGTYGEDMIHGGGRYGGDS